MAGQRERGLYLLLVLAFICPIFAKLSSEPRVYCPIGAENAWSYEHPGEWGKLCPLWSQCTSGSPRQSPVNFPPMSTKRVNGTLALLLSSVEVNLIRFGDYLSLPVTPSDNNSFRWKGQYYSLNRIEFHSPSEHALNGMHANFEIQLYFSLNKTQVAVALLYNVGTCSNEFLNYVLPRLPRTSKCSCGNGRVENFGPFSEECDDGSRNGPTARCRSNCKLARCGDGVKDPHEACDEGLKEKIPNRCRPTCHLPTCGDGVVDDGEQCDDGNNFGHDGCSGNCTLECGDGCLQPGEECDEGTRNSDARVPNSATQYCRTNFCLINKCGDGITDFNEECDAGSGRNGSTGGSLTPNNCRANCTLPRCGDGVVDTVYGEYCEPPNTARCSRNCTRIPACGDGILDAGEQCDSAGLYTRTCNPNCTLHCGNGRLDELEECDNGLSRVDGNNDTRPNSCRSDCRLWFCGDGVVDLGCEQCDNGIANNNDLKADACRTNCKFPTCGDGVTDKGEQCDDNNTISGDGCTCCKLDCGNGILEKGEECDEGLANSDNLPDRCRTKCFIHRCGDGVTDFDEECDFRSGNVANCSLNCTLPFCGDGIVQASLGEQCDNGETNSYYDITEGGCSPVCTLNFCGQSLSNADAPLYKLTLPPVKQPYFYVGSESHPPCSEKIEWLVSRNVGELSLDQLSAFQAVFGRNNRPTQRLGGRTPQIWAQGPPDIPNDYRFRNVCGNGIVENGESCDQGSFNSNTRPNACRVNCQAPKCGDGIIDSGEECDGGSHCSPLCTLIKYPAKRNSQGCWTIETQGTWDSCNAQVCNTGSNQSPIRLPEQCPQNSRTFNLNHPANIKYNPTPLVLFNTGSNILFPTLNGGTFNFRGVSYVLDHIEFKQPSEHWIGKKQYPLEVQLFHKSQSPVIGQMAVLSVLFEEGQNSTFLKPILDQLPFSDCHCGNGLKEAIQTAPGGRFAPEQCDCGADNNDHTPNSCRTSCQLPHCGDGVVDSCEACDQGAYNDNKPNRCRTTCVLPYCGDGIVDDLSGETCDDGNNYPGDGCDSYCQRECGNGKQGANEQCDNGNSNNDYAADACRTTCRLPTCGDGVVDSGEECDDGENNSDIKPDACRRSCSNPSCGDGVADPSLGETCDGGVTCDSFCHKLCGNGVLNAGEQCDNGTYNSDALPGACRSDCSLPKCGDGVVDPFEQCDTGAKASRLCTRCQLLCGNGRLDAGEECDDGGYNSDVRPDACRSDCTRARCNDGILDSDEQCDNGTMNMLASNRCRPWCKLPRCGDGVVDSDYCETCDDGNNFDGDGCSAECQAECGNGRIDPGEDCDNGNKNSNAPGTCCRTDCKYPRCGDGTTDPNEECDDGSMNSFGPNTCRPDCTKPKCGDGIVDHLYDEVCDQGSRNSWTTVDGCSPTCSPNVCRQSVWYNTTVNPADVLPKQAGVYMYSGSLNSPPCTENTEWFVFTTPQTLSSCQLAQFTKVLSNNNRCLQPTNQRQVEFLVQDSVCGDGLAEGNEECDNGAQNSNYAANACRRDCRRAHCGDGVRDAGEQCDSTPNCSASCSLVCTSCPQIPQEPHPSNATEPKETNIINVNFAKIMAN